MTKKCIYKVYRWRPHIVYWGTCVMHGLWVHEQNIRWVGCGCPQIVLLQPDLITNHKS